MDLAVDVYEETELLPKAERYGLTAQMRSAAASVPSNVAEGEGRYTLPDQLRFYGHARGSLYELETRWLLCDRVKYLDISRFVSKIEEVSRLLNGTIRSLDRRKT